MNRKRLPKNQISETVDLTSDDDERSNTLPLPKRRREDPLETGLSGDVDQLMISSSSDESCPAPWLRDMRKALTQVFRLNSFRTHQQQIISSAIQGKDVFVLMPTGGGKSLCYQLPAILQNHAPGVSIVVSPLLSLMQDQVHDLVCVKGIAAALLNSQMGAAHRRWVYSELKKPSSLMCLLYVTPEMLEKSKELVEALSCLYDQDRLTRFVIDEAHCVSQWGHDFRPDYKLLGNVRNRFSGVPIMALTATATPTVEADVLRCLGMQECKVFRQSFNRKNLSLEVVTKTPRSMADDIYQFIDDGRRNHSGIIYCIGRQQCESLAEELREAFGLTAEHYHAKLTPDMRNNVQREWKEGRIRIIVATIAFGMGIDKPDVRYVIHASIPSSLEGYYQEIGRAGRDGQPAVCRLYYTYRDASVHRGQIDRGGGNSTQKERLNTNLNAMIAYCENVIDCRRFLVLKYFGETFDASGCNQTCDNCLGAMNQTNITKDMTSLAIETIRLVRSVQSAGVTLLQVLDMLRGSQSKRFVDNGFLEATSYGAGKHLSRPDAERFMKHLVIMGILVEKTEYNNMGFSSAYLKVGKKALDVEREALKVNLSFSSTNVTPSSSSSLRSAETSGEPKRRTKVVLPGFVTALSLTNKDQPNTRSTAKSGSTSNATGFTRPVVTPKKGKITNFISPLNTRN